MTVRTQVLCCRVSAIDDDLRKRCESILSGEEIQRLNAFRSVTAAHEFVIGRALLRSALAERIGCAPGDLRFEPNANGKPQLVEPRSDWQFNLSHSLDWIVLAIGQCNAIGIDVETHRRNNNLSGIARRFFSKDEYARLSEQNEAEWLNYFFAVWTLKEAHAKALGTGLAKILSCSSIDVDFITRKIQLQLDGIARTTDNISSWLYRLDEQTSLALIEHGSSGAEPQLMMGAPFTAPQLLSLEPNAQGSARNLKKNFKELP